MRTPSFPTIHHPFHLAALTTLRAPFRVRRNSSSASRSSYASTASTSTSTSNSHPVYAAIAPFSAAGPPSTCVPTMAGGFTLLARQPSMLELDEERETFASGLSVLEPRPRTVDVIWGSLEERLGGL